MDKKIKLFEGQVIRRQWNADLEEWFFSVTDIIQALTGTDRPRRYWSDLKRKLISEGSQLSENIGQLKMPAEDGKQRKTDVMTLRQVLRLIQSIPSKKVEPLKLWLAEVGDERISEVQDPELTINRALKQYKALGYDDDWINLRLQSIEMRKELTNEWDKAGVKEGLEYAILTNLMTKTWSGKSIKEYKTHKGLTKENLRDNMTNTEIVLNMLAEVTTKEISSARKPKGFDESIKIAKDGANVARKTRQNIEKETGKSVISDANAKEIGRLNDKTYKKLDQGK